MNLMIDLYDYQLAQERIAQKACEPRDSSKLMVINKKLKTIEHRIFSDIVDYFLPGDVLVINNTRVIPARLFGQKATGAYVETFLLKEVENGIWETLCKPGKRVKKGTTLYFPNYSNTTITGTCLDIKENGNRMIAFENNGSSTINESLFSIGTLPLPPYIHETTEENERYQTIYAEKNGAVAAPTAGLHFTKYLFEKLISKGVQIIKVTLHVGLGTFRPISETIVENHIMHSEEFHVTPDSIQALVKAKEKGNRIIAVGTTSVRVLETIARDIGHYANGFSGHTNIYIYPPYQFKMVDAMITNFHLPRSTLLLLISAFSGRQTIMAAYQTAIDNNYRFYSFGDACLLL
ncbi:MAG TPA: tRNA preQ1(34) S-adenosylmethionine ribosyltransferase-isomerase QueA [Bacteroidales bacterium]|nr:tRNA preQ1(34) S-adenosylmethionine ribosyltransferase-isomerase QueA [Bacteroidales bacterium]